MGPEGRDVRVGEAARRLTQPSSDQGSECVLEEPVTRRAHVNRRVARSVICDDESDLKTVSTIAIQVRNDDALIGADEVGHADAFSHSHHLGGREELVVDYLGVDLTTDHRCADVPDVDAAWASGCEDVRDSNICNWRTCQLGGNFGCCDWIRDNGQPLDAVASSADSDRRCSAERNGERRRGERARVDHDGGPITCYTVEWHVLLQLDPSTIGASSATTGRRQHISAGGKEDIRACVCRVVHRGIELLHVCDG